MMKWVHSPVLEGSSIGYLRLCECLSVAVSCVCRVCLCLSLILCVSLSVCVYYCVPSWGLCRVCLCLSLILCVCLCLCVSIIVCLLVGNKED